MSITKRTLNDSDIKRNIEYQKIYEDWLSTGSSYKELAKKYGRTITGIKYIIDKKINE